MRGLLRCSPGETQPRESSLSTPLPRTDAGLRQRGKLPGLGRGRVARYPLGCGRQWTQGAYVRGAHPAAGWMDI